MTFFKGTEYARLETDRLELIEINPAMSRVLLNECSDGEIVDFLGLDSIEDFSVDLEKYRTGMETYRISYANFIMVNKQRGRFIGRCGFHMWFALHQRAEIGYAMNSDDDKGKGYMSEAIAALIDHGFGPMGLNRIEAFVGLHNPASQRLMHKFGFTLEGVMREHYCKDGLIEDSLCFSLLKREYIKAI
ncbi:MAG: hypothetical protein BGO69_19825 [Bacteroidetes bacterium 46-16]|nr:MAG: hypothetical protein BGO69_19825 [Bacteroidetes bacterium 46-16]